MISASASMPTTHKRMFVYSKFDVEVLSFIENVRITYSKTHDNGNKTTQA